jgi:hypothetical protein
VASSNENIGACPPATTIASKRATLELGDGPGLLDERGEGRRVEKAHADEVGCGVAARVTRVAHAVGSHLPPKGLKISTS